MSKVSITKIVDYDYKSALNNTLNLIGGIESLIKLGDRVLLKPNLNGGDCTNIKLVEALIQILFEKGIRNIFIGESSFGNHHITQKFFKDSGYFALAEKYGIEIKNFNDTEYLKVKPDNPRVISEIQIAKEAVEADFIINLPIMKVHYATGVTLCMKNLKGLISPENKKYFHEIGLHDAVVDLNNCIKPGLNIVDASSCMEKMGPHGGDIFELGLILAGESAWEVDYIGSEMMQYSLDEVKHLKYYMESNSLSVSDIEEIDVVGEKVNDVKYPFKKVSMNKIIPDGIQINESDACSTCMNALILACKFIDSVPEGGVDVYLGEKNSFVPNSNKQQIAFGNCCKIEGIDKIKGCPPYPFKLKELLNK